MTLEELVWEARAEMREEWLLRGSFWEISTEPVSDSLLECAKIIQKHNPSASLPMCIEWQRRIEAKIMTDMREALATRK
jgi:hypothetical protein